MSTRWSYHERGDGTDHTETAEGDTVFNGRVISACLPGKECKGAGEILKHIFRTFIAVTSSIATMLSTSWNT
jgi:hypothetical protein